MKKIARFTVAIVIAGSVLMHSPTVKAGQGPWYYTKAYLHCSEPPGAANNSNWSNSSVGFTAVGPSSSGQYDYRLDIIAYDTYNSSTYDDTDVRLLQTNQNPPGTQTVIGSIDELSSTPDKKEFYFSVPAGQYYGQAVQVRNTQSPPPAAPQAEYRITFSGLRNDTVGTNAPELQVLKPLDNSYIADWPSVGIPPNTQPGIQGLVKSTSSDSIATVVVAIEKNSTGQFWNNGDGSDAPISCSEQPPNTKGWYRKMTWMSTARRTDAAYPGWQVWERIGSVPRPANGDLPDGAYTLWIVALDNGQRGTLYKTFFNVSNDTVAPTVAITNPPNNSHRASLSVVNGTASDGGSGVNSVSVQLKRVSDNAYWTGSTWTGIATSLAANYSAGSWSITSSLPNAANLVNGGTYQVIAKATDNVGNTTTSSPSTFTADTVAPSSITITNPAANANLSAMITSVSGTASDALSGIATGTFGLCRYKNNPGAWEYWQKDIASGDWSWGPLSGTGKLVEHPLSVNTANGTWSGFVSEWPSGYDLLTSGSSSTPILSYRIAATIKDKAGNPLSTNQYFNVSNDFWVKVTDPAMNETVSQMPVYIHGQAGSNLADPNNIINGEFSLIRLNTTTNTYEYWQKLNSQWKWDTLVAGGDMAFPLMLTTVLGDSYANAIWYASPEEWPTGAQLPHSDLGYQYRIKATVFDQSSRSASVNHYFKVD